MMEYAEIGHLQVLFHLLCHQNVCLFSTNDFNPDFSYKFLYLKKNEITSVQNKLLFLLATFSVFLFLIFILEIKC